MTGSFQASIDPGGGAKKEVQQEKGEMISVAHLEGDVLTWVPAQNEVMVGAGEVHA